MEANDVGKEPKWSYLDSSLLIAADSSPVVQTLRPFDASRENDPHVLWMAFNDAPDISTYPSSDDSTVQSSSKDSEDGTELDDDANRRSWHVAGQQRSFFDDLGETILHSCIATLLYSEDSGATLSCCQGLSQTV
jgi:hypothetical protein